MAINVISGSSLKILPVGVTAMIPVLYLVGREFESCLALMISVNLNLRVWILEEYQGTYIKEAI